MKHELIDINECPICSSKNKTTHLSIVDHNVSNDVFTISKCSDCGFLFTDPIPSKETIGKYYKSDNYISHSGTKKGLINSVYHVVRNYQISKKEQLISTLTNKKKLLDIGCGTGEFVQFCEEKGWQVFGTEPDTKTRARVQIDSVCSDIWAQKLSKETFSVVTMWHVLEHVYELNNSLNKIVSLIEKNGFLVVAVPNHDSFDAKKYKENWVAYDVPIHLHHFRKEDIKNLCAKHDLKLISVKPLIFDAFYISLLSEQKRNGNVLFGFINGLISNIKAKKNKNYSSLIYILKKC